MTNAPSTPLSARSMAAESFQSPSTNSPPWFAQLDALSRLRTSARTSLPCANRCSAVAPPTFPVIPITKNMRFSPDLEGQSTAPVGSTDERQNGPDTGIARVEGAPCHRAQKQGNDLRRRPQLTNADMGADGAFQKARHQDRAEGGGGRDGIKDGAGEYDRTHDTGQVHREPGFLQHARDLCRREKLNSAVCYQSDHDKRAHYPAGPQGAVQGQSLRQLMQVHSLGHLSSSDGGSHIRKLLCLLGIINTEKVNTLFSLWRTMPRDENAESRTHPHIHNGSGNGELHPRGR